MFGIDKKNNKKKFKEINFNHLMSIYETNYFNFMQVFKYKSHDLSKKSSMNRPFVIENIFQDKYTRIFRMYNKFHYDDSLRSNKTFSIKSHLIFYMYNDAQLLEVKSLKDNKTFQNSITQKIKLNLNLFYWLKNYINQ
tara:strand:+ start:7229 stop:7642 length:414 start_codon:yes stop_codon:yes gene_type:complete